MSITAIARNFDGNPNIVTIVTDNTLAEITTAGYWTSATIVQNIHDLQHGDFQWAPTDIALISYAPDYLVNFFVYDAVNHTFIANPAAGGLSNTLASGNLFVGNGSNIATGVTLSGDITNTNAGVTAIGANKVLSSMVSPLLMKYVAVPITAAEFNGMYAAPKLLLAAGGANTLVVVRQCQLLMTYGSAAFAAGGPVSLQWDSTANGAGVIASTTLAAAVFFPTASTGFNFNSGVVPETFTTTVNKGIYISNITQAFTTGTGSSFVAHLWYSTIPTV